MTNLDSGPIFDEEKFGLGGNCLEHSNILKSSNTKQQMHKVGINYNREGNVKHK